MLLPLLPESAENAMMSARGQVYITWGIMMTEKYLTINQLAKACNTSRSAILRMEKANILNAVYVNPETGYRYYNDESVLRVLRILSLQELGFTHKELNDYFSGGNYYQHFIERLQNKMNVMEFHLSNMRLQLKKNRGLEVSEFVFPELYCYAEVLPNVTDLSTVRPHIWELFDKVVHKGYTINRDMNPFVLVDYKAIEKNDFKNIGYDYEICIPVLPRKDKKNLIHFEKISTVSNLIYGGASDMELALQQIITYCEDNNIKTTDRARVVAVVNSYPGESVPIEYWTLRVCIPYENLNDTDIIN